MAFAVRGFVRGTADQVFGVLGLVSGLWAAGAIAQWVGLHWQEARPAAFFWALRWLVAISAAMAVAGLFHWWGSGVRQAMHDAGLGWLDRAGGTAVGLTVGVLVLAVAAMAVLLAPAPRAVGATVARAELTGPLLAGGQAVCGVGGRVIPGCRWLSSRFVEAERRARAGAT